MKTTFLFAIIALALHSYDNLGGRTRPLEHHEEINCLTVNH